MKKIVLFIILVIMSPSLILNADRDQLNQVVNITGISSDRVAKMAEAIEKGNRARILIRKKQFEEGFEIYRQISTINGFDQQDEDGFLYELALAQKIAGQYDQSLLTLERVANRTPSWKAALADDIAEVNSIINFNKTGNKKIIFNFIDWFKRNDEKLLPPKGYKLDDLARITRLYEIIGEIDQALNLVEQYHSYYFPKKISKEPSGIVKNIREGILLLKEALLRDKREGKKIYAQELINTTDYFGFV